MLPAVEILTNGLCNTLTSLMHNAAAWRLKSFATGLLCLKTRMTSSARNLMARREVEYAAGTVISASSPLSSFKYSKISHPSCDCHLCTLCRQFRSVTLSGMESGRLHAFSHIAHACGWCWWQAALAIWAKRILSPNKTWAGDFSEVQIYDSNLSQKHCIPAFVSSVCRNLIRTSCLHESLNS